MKCSVAIILATMAGTIALQLASPVMAQSGIVHTVHKGGAFPRAEVSRRTSPLPPFVDRLPVSAIPCPWLEGYPDCHPVHGR
jgi:hypothetical protein